MLPLTEELFLLSLLEKKRTISLPDSSVMPYALAAAMLVELALAGKIRLEKDRIVALDGAEDATTDPHLCDLLGLIRELKKPRKITHWITAAAGKGKKLEEDLLEDLIARGVLKEEEKKILWIIPHLEYSELNASAKFQCKQRLREIVLCGLPADPQSVALLSLLKSMNLLDHVFTRDELKAAGKRVKEMTHDEAVGPALIETLDSLASAAILVALSSTNV